MKNTHHQIEKQYKDFICGEILNDPFYLIHNRNKIKEFYNEYPENILNKLAIYYFTIKKYAYSKDLFIKSVKIKENETAYLYLSFLHEGTLELQLNYLKKALHINVNRDICFQFIKVVYKLIEKYPYSSAKYYSDVELIVNIVEENKFNLQEDSIALNCFLDLFKYVKNNRKKRSLLLKKMIVFNKMAYTRLYFYYSLLDKESIKNICNVQNYILKNTKKIKHLKLLTNDMDKINIGYIGNDYYKHPVGKFMCSIFKNHNKKKFNVFCYHLNSIEDNITELIKKNVHFKNVNNLSDLDIANTIKNDKIDILIDQIVFSCDRMDILRYKPANYIINYLTSPISSVYPEIDYIFTDKYLFTEKNKIMYKEKPKYLKYGLHLLDKNIEKQFLCNYNKEKNAFHKNNIIFGITASYLKYDTDFIYAISKILDKIPNAIIFIRNYSFVQEINKVNLLESFKHYDCDLKRINIDFVHDPIKFYECYNHIDILLDTFVYGGCTTIFDSLISSTPIITLVGDKWCQRYGYSYLKHLQIEELITYNVDEYIDTAIKLAKNKEKLKYYHKNLSKLLKESVLCNTELFMHEYEKHFYEIKNQNKKS